MAVTMDKVRAALDPEEPNYAEAAKLGSDALPHLETLVGSDDTMLASKAAYLASLIKDPKAGDVVSKAAGSDDPVVRVAAAAAASNLAASSASAVLVDLVGDPDPGVRMRAQASVPDRPSAKLAEALKALEDKPAERGDVAPADAALESGVMPGEPGGEAAGTMPGERSGGMPGEGQKMPGE
jgi:HEAT repeat protein